MPHGVVRAPGAARRLDELDGREWPEPHIVGILERGLCRGERVVIARKGTANYLMLPFATRAARDIDGASPSSTQPDRGPDGRGNGRSGVGSVEPQGPGRSRAAPQPRWS